MVTIFGIPTALLFGQLLLGIINGAFYATLSLGLAVIFGMMNIANFAHGALYMMGAVLAWLLLNSMGIGILAGTPTLSFDSGCIWYVDGALYTKARKSYRSSLRYASHIWNGACNSGCVSLLVRVIWSSIRDPEFFVGWSKSWFYVPTLLPSMGYRCVTWNLLSDLVHDRENKVGFVSACSDGESRTCAGFRY